MMEEILVAGLDKLGLDTVKAKDLTRYATLLLEKNKVINLTAITDIHEVAAFHFLDCAVLASRYDLRGKKLIDVGTGAGFPGMVIAIVCPEAEVTLLDPLEKRLVFLQSVIDALGLTNVTLLHARGEDAGREEGLREQFDVATARAVADLSVLGELCLPFVKVGGRFLPMKSLNSGKEYAQAEERLGELGAGPGTRLDYKIPGTQVAHRIWDIPKVAPTPPEYPRRWKKIFQERRESMETEGK